MDDFQVGEYVRGIVTKLQVQEEKVLMTLKAPPDFNPDIILVSGDFNLI